MRGAKTTRVYVCVGGPKLLYSPLEVLDPRAEAFYYLPNAPYFVELNLELVDLAQDFVEAGDFGVGILDRVARAGVLGCGCGLRLGSQCLIPLLNGVH